MVVLNALIAAFAKALKKSGKDIFEKKTQELLDNDIYVLGKTTRNRMRIHCENTPSFDRTPS